MKMKENFGVHNPLNTKYQHPHPQAKLVSVLEGEVFDVVVIFGLIRIHAYCLTFPFWLYCISRSDGFPKTFKENVL